MTGQGVPPANTLQERPGLRSCLQRARGSMIGCIETLAAIEGIRSGPTPQAPGAPGPDGPYPLEVLATQLEQGLAHLHKSLAVLHEQLD